VDEIELTGKVVIEEYGAGSKSQHDAVFLVVGDKKYRLKMKGGNPFYDPGLHKYAGKKIKVVGNDTPHFFIITHKPVIVPKRKKDS
jgi:hypothetical protein